MRISAAGRNALTSCVAAAMLAGCGGSQPLGTPGAISQKTIPHATATSLADHTSGSEDLLYVGSYDSGLFILSYPEGQVVATFQPVWGHAMGLCSDSEGDVFVLVDQGVEGYIEKYARGATTPITMLDDKYIPEQCAVDSVTGNLAVTNNDGETPTLAIYQGAQGNPTYYADSSMDHIYSCAYDESGDLFVDGWDGSMPTLAEIPYGGGSFTNIMLNELLKYDVGSLQWVGDYLAMSVKNVIYHIQTSGSTSTIIGKTRLARKMRSPWEIDGTTLVTTYLKRASEVAYWKYPRGGAPTQVLKEFNPSSIDGLTISVGSTR